MRIDCNYSNRKVIPVNTNFCLDWLTMIVTLLVFEADSSLVVYSMNSCFIFVCLFCVFTKKRYILSKKSYHEMIALAVRGLYFVCIVSM